MQACSWFNIKCSLYPGHVGGLHQSSCTVLTVSAGSCNWRRESSSAPGGGRLPSLHSCVYASPLSPVFPAHDKAAAETHLGPCSWEGREGEEEEVLLKVWQRLFYGIPFPLLISPQSCQLAKSGVGGRLGKLLQARAFVLCAIGGSGGAFSQLSTLEHCYHTIPGWLCSFLH